MASGLEATHPETIKEITRRRRASRDVRLESFVIIMAL
jgi:hypothetical protein